MNTSFDRKLSNVYTQFTSLMGMKRPAPNPNATIRQATHSARHHTGSSRRLTDNEREQVIGMLKNQVPVMMIARIFKVSRPSVYNIRDTELPQYNRHGGEMAAAGGK